VKLALYSDQIPPLTDPIDARVRAWLPEGARIGYIPSSPDHERFWFAGLQEYYRRYGFSLTFFGLEDEFDESLLGELLTCDAIHLTGGNTYCFLYWLRARGMIEPLRQYALNGGVLIGVSAGAILMTPDIRTSSLCGDTLYPGLEDYTGLSLVNFAIVPHYNGSPVAEAALTEFSKGFNGHVYAVPDGGAVIVDGDEIEFVAEFREILD